MLLLLSEHIARYKRSSKFSHDQALSHLHSLEERYVAMPLTDFLVGLKFQTRLIDVLREGQTNTFL